MIVVTGAAGFIGSCMVQFLNESGHSSVLAVDEFSHPQKNRNLSGKQLIGQVDRFHYIADPLKYGRPELVIHLGARTDTAEFSIDLLRQLNTDYSKKIWEFCTRHQIPLIYASSAATYGAGEMSFSDDHRLIPGLVPLNPYGQSKQEFDLWVLEQQDAPPVWAGLKFFNVFGPNEYHKGRMASMVMHGTRQILERGSIRLFRSHRPDYGDGQQTRDFVYVKDVIRVIEFMMKGKAPNGIYNLGTGRARPWNDLAASIFSALGKPVNIEYIDIPADIRESYQYHTEARMEKLFSAGYPGTFMHLEDSVADYVCHYLTSNSYY